MVESGLTPGNTDWLQKFQWSVNDVIKSSGGEEAASEKYAEVARAWNNAEPPEEMKRK